MSLPSVKSLVVSTGLYRPARWLARHLRPAELRTHLGDIELYRSLVPAGALCFDVGANIGVKSEALLKAGARVVSFEPHPLLLPELRARCAHLENWSLVPTALGSSAGIATLYAREFHGESSLDQTWSGQVVGRYHVPVVPLDVAIRAFGAPWYCKIDVEGWELEVLKGLTQPIAVASIEFHLTDKEVAKTLSCLERLAQLGMTHANLCSAESSRFHLPDWVAIDEFTKWFPGDLKQSLPGDQYGDIFVKNSNLTAPSVGSAT